MRNPWETIGFRIEVGKLLGFSIVLVFLIYLFPKSYFLYLFLGIIFLIGVFSYVFYGLVEVPKKPKYHPDQIRYLKVMIFLFTTVGILCLCVGIYDYVIGIFDVSQSGTYTFELLVSMFVCFIIAAFTYSGLSKTGAKLFKR